MGRAKLNMELIAKDKSRNITFKKRKEGLIRKMLEFATLCDVDACIIIYGPRTETGRAEPEIWPQDPDKVKRIVEVYKSKNKDSGSRSSGLSNFFHNRNKRIEQELTKLKRKNLESKYPTWSGFLNSKTEFEVQALLSALTNKFDHVKSRVDFLKRSMQGYDGNLVEFRPGQPHGAGPSFYAPAQRVGDVIYQQSLSSVHVCQDLLHAINQGTTINNKSDRVVQFDGASAFFNGQIFYTETELGGDWWWRSPP